MAKRVSRSVQTMISLREAARRLQVNAQYIKGVADAMGVTLFRTRKALLMTEKDFDRVRLQIEDLQVSTA